MENKQDRKKYLLDYHKKNYKRVPLDITLSKYDEIKNAAASVGETVNGYIKNAINTRIKSGK